MNWVCSVAAAMVAVAVVFRLLWWARERSQQFAAQRQGASGSSTDSGQAGHGTEFTDKAASEVEAKNQRS